jgi:uncharacterized surface protein with fasciclin (FAS1) repeats
MKNRFMRWSIFNSKIFFSAIISITVIAGCVKSTSTAAITPGTSIAGIVKAATNLTILDSAISKAGLVATLDSLNPISTAGPFTLFAPVNIAFSNIGFTDSTIYKDSVSYLKRLVLYHLISGQKYYYAALPQGVDYPIPSASGDMLYLTVGNGYIFVNGNLVTQGDITAGNGVIQALSGVLIPPSGTILQTLQSLSSTSDTTLSFLFAALQHASSSTAYANLDSLLSSTTNAYTILAPTNSAFAALGDTTIAVINNANPDTLARILQCHLLSGRVFSSDFPQSGSLLSIAGDSLAFVTTFNLTVQSKGDSSIASNITSVNRVATNGVIHKIDKVLLP